MERPCSECLVMGSNLDSRTHLAVLWAIAPPLVWGGAFPAIHMALDHLEPIPLAAVRFGIAGTVLAVLLVRSRPPLPRGQDWLRVAACGAIGIALYNIFLNNGQRSISAGAASFIANTQPIVAGVLGSLILKERFGARAWMGTAVSLGGVLLIAAAQPGGLQFGSGASLVALASICAGTYFVLQRPLVARYGALASASFTILAGALLLSPWLASGLQQAVASPPSGWGAVLFLALGPGVLGYLAWMRALDCFGAARATNFLYLIAPWAALLDWGITGERPSPLTWVGGAAALLGMVLVHLDRQHGARVAPRAARPQAGELASRCCPGAPEQARAR